MRLLVDQTQCEGHGRCAAVAPDLCELNDDGFNVSAEVPVPETLRQQATLAINSCPEKCIRLDG